MPILFDFVSQTRHNRAHKKAPEGVLQKALLTFASFHFIFMVAVVN